MMQREDLSLLGNLEGEGLSGMAEPYLRPLDIIDLNPNNSGLHFAHSHLENSNAKNSIISPAAAHSRCPDATNYDFSQFLDPGAIQFDNFYGEMDYGMEEQENIEEMGPLFGSIGEVLNNEQEQQVLANQQMMESQSFFPGLVEPVQGAQPKGPSGNNRRQKKSQRKIRERTNKLVSAQDRHLRLQKIQDANPNETLHREKSQRQRKPSQKMIESWTSMELARNVIGRTPPTLQNSKRKPQSEFEALGSRSTSEKSSNQSALEQKFKIFETTQTSQLSLKTMRKGNLDHSLDPQDQMQTNGSEKRIEPERETREAGRSFFSLRNGRKSFKSQIRESLGQTGHLGLQDDGTYNEGEDLINQNNETSEAEFQFEEPSHLSARKQGSFVAKDLEEEKTLGDHNKRNFLIQIPNVERKKSQNAQFSFNDIVMNSDISGKIDTSKWMNQANIVTPDFKRSTMLLSTNSTLKVQKYMNTFTKKVVIEDMDDSRPCRGYTLEQLQQKEKDFSCKRNLTENFELIRQDGDEKFGEDKAQEQEFEVIPEEENELNEGEIMKAETELSEDEEEGTDDECYIERHRVLEEKEVQRYNSGFFSHKRTQSRGSHMKKREDFQAYEDIQDESEEQEDIPLLPMKCHSEMPPTLHRQASKKKSKSKVAGKKRKRAYPKGPNELNQHEKATKTTKVLIDEETMQVEAVKNKKVPDSAQTVSSYNLRNQVWKERDEDFVYENILSLKAPSRRDKKGHGQGKGGNKGKKNGARGGRW